MQQIQKKLYLNVLPAGMFFQIPDQQTHIQKDILEQTLSITYEYILMFILIKPLLFQFNTKGTIFS